MPDNDISFGLSANDNVSPILRAIDQELAKIGNSGARAGAQLAQGFREAGISIQNALKMAADPKVVSDLQAYLKQLTSVNSSLKYLFEQRGGVEAYFKQVGTKTFEAIFRDPAGMAAKGLSAEQAEGLRRVANDAAKAASEMASLNRFQKEARAESEQLAIAMENIAEMTKQASASRLAETEARARSEASELANFEKEAAQFREQSAIALEKIAELEGIARKEAQARALAEKEIAEAEAAQLAETLERVRAMKPTVPYEGEGGAGGTGKHFGGFLQQAAEGFREGGVLEAASRGLVSFGQGMLSMASWILEWEVIQKAMELAAGALQHVVEEMQIADQLSQRLGGSISSTSTAFEALKVAAFNSGQSLADTNKRFEEFRSHGTDWQGAVQGAQVAGNVFRQTGIEITGAVTKAMEFGAGIEDLREMGRAGHPELIDKAHMMAVEENTRQIQQMVMGHQHELDQRVLEDTVTSTNREMEQRQRLEEDAFRESSRLEERAMQARHMARNRDLEDEQRSIEQSMQARHRAATQAEEDSDRAHSRAISHATAFKGLGEAILEGTGVKGKSGADVTGAIPAQYIDKLRSQMQEGAKALGIDWSTAQYLGKEGVISPGSLIQAGEEKREDERREASRARETESIKTGIALQKQATAERRQQQDQELEMTQRIQDTEYAMQKRNQIERMALQFAIQDQERNFQREYQNKQWEFEKTIAQFRIDIQKAILATYEAEIAKTKAQIPQLGKGGTATGESRPGAFPTSPEQKALEERQRGLREQEKAAQQPKTPQEEALDKVNKALGDAQKSLGALDSTLTDNKKKLTDVNSSSLDNTTSTIENTKGLESLRQSFDKYSEELKKIYGSKEGAGAGGGGGGGGAVGSGGGGMVPSKEEPSAVEHHDYGPYGQQDIYKDAQGNIIGARAYGPKYSRQVLKPWEGQHRELPRRGGGEEAEERRIQAFALEMGLRGGGAFGSGGKPQAPSGLEPGSEAYNYWMEAHARPQEEWDKPYYPGEPSGAKPRPGSRMFGPTIDVGKGLSPLPNTPEERRKAKEFFPYGPTPGQQPTAAPTQPPQAQASSLATEATLAKVASNLDKVLSTT